jgi:hypothetical protein
MFLVDSELVWGVPIRTFESKAFSLPPASITWAAHWSTKRPTRFPWRASCLVAWNSKAAWSRWTPYTLRMKPPARSSWNTGRLSTNGQGQSTHRARTDRNTRCRPPGRFSPLMNRHPPRLACRKSTKAAKRAVVLSPLQSGVPTVSGQKTTLSQCGVWLSQRAKAFAMKFPFDVKAVLPIGLMCA